MIPEIVTHARGAFMISTDRAFLDINVIHTYLSRDSYWAQGRTLDTVQRSLDHSLCFGVYEGAAQVGFARVVTDYATFGWIADVFILPSHRGQGLSKWLVESIVAHPRLQNLRRLVLATRDAHELYAKYGGFVPLVEPARWMEKRRAPTP